MSTRDPEEALLSLTVLDPACGSGHFLIATAQRIATRLAAYRTGETSPPPPEVRHALRQVIGRCIHGIDVNPMAVELCKVNLWLETVDPGRPLSFLDNHIVCGNALLGATPELLAGGVPDEAFKELTGDDKKTVTALRKVNKRERAGEQSLFSYDMTELLKPLAKDATGIDQLGDDTFNDVEAKSAAWANFVTSDAYHNALLAANTWCAAFVAPKRPGQPAITEATYQTALAHPDRISDQVQRLVDDCAVAYAFLHPHLAFPAIFGGNQAGGFDVVLGNPPWEKVKLSEKEFFSARAPEIADNAGARRKALITKLQAEDPALWDAYQAALRHAEGESHVLRSSGRYPLCGRGDVNTYAVFAEAIRDALNPLGRLGIIVPTGIATDDTTKDFFADCVRTGSLVSLYSFYDRKVLFTGADVHAFCLLTLAGDQHTSASFEFAFFLRQPTDLSDPERHFTLTPEDLALINPNSRTAPLFRTQRDAELSKKIYRHIPVLIREGVPDGNPWGIELSTMFHMTNDSGRFRTADELEGEGASLAGNRWRRGEQRWLPLYEAKMVHHFNHRWGDYAMKSSGSGGNALPDILPSVLDDPDYEVQPRYWVAEPVIRAAFRDPAATWLMGFRDICRSTDERTMIATAIPLAAVGNSEAILESSADAHLRCLLAAVLSSFAHDFVARFKVGGTHINFFIAKQLAVPPPSALLSQAPWSRNGTVGSWLAPRILELTYTAWDLAGFAASLGHHGPPFHWNADRRRLVRAELDAAFFRIYGHGYDDVDYVMDTFPVVRRNDEKEHGEYLTKRLILERYEALAKAAESSEPYQTILDPPPADPSVAHSAER